MLRRIPTLPALLLLALASVAFAAIIKPPPFAADIPGLGPTGLPDGPTSPVLLKSQIDDTTLSFVAKGSGKVGNESGVAVRQVTVPFAAGPFTPIPGGPALNVTGTAALKYGKPDKKVPPMSKVDVLSVGQATPVAPTT